MLQNPFHESDYAPQAEVAGGRRCLTATASVDSSLQVSCNLTPLSALHILLQRSSRAYRQFSSTCTMRARTTSFRIGIANRHVCRARSVRICASQVRSVGGLDEPIELVDGKVTSGPSLAVTVNGIEFPNPFVIGSGPPGTRYSRFANCAVLNCFDASPELPDELPLPSNIPLFTFLLI